ncbi:hypothetical protein ACFQZ8_22275, partial [Micromonospora azadirachtae]
MSHDVVSPMEGTVHPTGDADGSVNGRNGDATARVTSSGTGAVGPDGGVRPGVIRPDLVSPLRGDGPGEPLPSAG